MRALLIFSLALAGCGETLHMEVDAPVTEGTDIHFGSRIVGGVRSVSRQGDRSRIEVRVDEGISSRLNANACVELDRGDLRLRPGGQGQYAGQLIEPCRGLSDILGEFLTDLEEPDDDGSVNFGVARQIAEHHAPGVGVELEPQNKPPTRPEEQAEQEPAPEERAEQEVEELDPVDEDPADEDPATEH